MNREVNWNRTFRHFTVVSCSVEVLLYMVCLRDVHSWHSGRSGFVHLSSLQLPHLLQICLMLPPNLVSYHTVPDSAGQVQGIVHEGQASTHYAEACHIGREVVAYTQ